MTEPSEVPPLRQRILDLVYNPQYRATKPKDIHRVLKLSEDDYRPLRKLIKRMVIDRENCLRFQSYGCPDRRRCP